MSGHSLITVQKMNKSGNVTGDLFVVVDPLGCSIGEAVLVSTGSAAREALQDSKNPIDMVIIGIVDSCDFL